MLKSKVDRQSSSLYYILPFWIGLSSTVWLSPDISPILLSLPKIYALAARGSRLWRVVDEAGK
jgi:hypothetical protein